MFLTPFSEVDKRLVANPKPPSALPVQKCSRKETIAHDQRCDYSRASSNDDTLERRGEQVCQWLFDISSQQIAHVRMARGITKLSVQR